MAVPPSGAGLMPRKSRQLGISVARVYLTKHRTAALIKKETLRLEKELERNVAARFR